MFSLVLHLKDPLQNLVIELCGALKLFSNDPQLFIKVTSSFVAI